jgi:hypothetical protein
MIKILKENLNAVVNRYIKTGSEHRQFYYISGKKFIAKVMGNLRH